jgi:hypothetical protein
MSLPGSFADQTVPRLANALTNALHTRPFSHRTRLRVIYMSWPPRPATLSAAIGNSSSCNPRLQGAFIAPSSANLPFPASRHYRTATSFAHSCPRSGSHGIPGAVDAPQCPQPSHAAPSPMQSSVPRQPSLHVRRSRVSRSGSAAPKPTRQQEYFLPILK